MCKQRAEGVGNKIEKRLRRQQIDERGWEMSKEGKKQTIDGRLRKILRTKIRTNEQ